MKISPNTISGVLMLITCQLFSAFVSQNVIADDQLKTISVTGTAEIQVKPDQAVLTFTIETRKKTLAETTAANDKSIAQVVKFLNSAGVKDSEVRTDMVRIDPIYQQQKNRFKGQMMQSSLPSPNASNVAPPADKDEFKLEPVGYTAQRGISVEVNDLSDLESIYKGLLSNGVNKVRGVEFRTTDLRRHRDQARLNAIKAAREKANALAEALDAQLAGVQTINESSMRPSPNYMLQNSINFSGAGSSNGGSFAEGMIKVNASISVVFELKNTDFGNDAKEEKESVKEQMGAIGVSKI